MIGMVWARVGKDVERLVRELASSKGISISEYMRQLIPEDLDKRSVFTDRLKKRGGK